MKLNRKERLKWIRKQIIKSQILRVTMPSTLGRYQKVLFTLLKKHYIFVAMLIMHIKIVIEKNGFLDFFRRLQ